MKTEEPPPLACNILYMMIYEIPHIINTGIDEVNDPNIPLEEALNDKHRVDYYYHHLSYVKKAIK